MRLIDADKFVFEINIEISRRKEDDPTSRVLKAMITDIDNRPTVDAVPLDKLCAWLEAYARTPIYNLHHTAEWWKESLTKWMEGQHEQDQ